MDGTKSSLRPARLSERMPDGSGCGEVAYLREEVGVDQLEDDRLSVHVTRLPLLDVECFSFGGSGSVLSDRAKTTAVDDVPELEASEGEAELAFPSDVVLAIELLGRQEEVESTAMYVREARDTGGSGG